MHIGSRVNVGKSCQKARWRLPSTVFTMIQSGFIVSPRPSVPCTVQLVKEFGGQVPSGKVNLVGHIPLCGPVARNSNSSDHFQSRPSHLPLYRDETRRGGEVDLEQRKGEDTRNRSLRAKKPWIFLGLVCINTLPMAKKNMGVVNIPPSQKIGGSTTGRCAVSGKHREVRSRVVQRGRALAPMQLADVRWDIWTVFNKSAIELWMF
ncbi:hypothetical protein DFH07DRAFT_779335 [Mycena maculata]|uniref:Uncharacterized protein n=1 Tax=Mycena maculata TaxID=230809 RepID=A0AAD7IA61_9AGAR|nr:hypothetical protein DFH07DRAFT_779335 [Mycena maculata]